MSARYIHTTEQAEDFLADATVRERVDNDRLMVNAVTAAVALGTSRNSVQRMKNKLNITSRRCFVGPLRKAFKQEQEKRQ
jgi:hypothetical protein